MSNQGGTDPRIAFGAQPAEVELTDEDIKKFDLFTQAEIDAFMHWEMELIRQTPYETVKAMMEEIRKKQRETEFCLQCGAGIGKHRREGEGTCPACADK